MTDEEFEALQRHMPGWDDDPVGEDVLELDQCVYDVMADGTVVFRR